MMNKVDRSASFTMAPMGKSWGNRHQNIDTIKEGIITTGQILFYGIAALLGLLCWPLYFSS